MTSEERDKLLLDLDVKMGNCRLSILTFINMCSMEMTECRALWMRLMTDKIKEGISPSSVLDTSNAETEWK